MEGRMPRRLHEHGRFRVDRLEPNDPELRKRASRVHRMYDAWEFTTRSNPSSRGRESLSPSAVVEQFEKSILSPKEIAFRMGALSTSDISDSDLVRGRKILAAFLRHRAAEAAGSTLAFGGQVSMPNWISSAHRMAAWLSGASRYEPQQGSVCGAGLPLMSGDLDSVARHACHVVLSRADTEEQVHIQPRFRRIVRAALEDARVRFCPDPSQYSGPDAKGHLDETPLSNDMSARGVGLVAILAVAISLVFALFGLTRSWGVHQSHVDVGSNPTSEWKQSRQIS